MGGDVVVAAAPRLGERVAGLVWVDTYCTLGTPASPEDVEAVLAPLRADFRAATRSLAGGMFLPTSDPDVVEWVLADMASAPPDVAVPVLRQAASFEPAVVQALREITVPVVAVNPDHKPSDVEGLRRHGVETVPISGVGHFAMLEDAAVGRWTALDDQAGRRSTTNTTTTTRPAFSSSRERVSHALERMLNEAEAGLFEHLWMDLDPAQQAVIPRDRFVACETATWQRLAESGSRYVVTRPLEEMGEPLPVHGTGATRDQVVLVELGVQSDTAGGAHRTAFLAAVDGRWRWIMGSGEVDAYIAGNCPSHGLPSFY